MRRVWLTAFAIGAIASCSHTEPTVSISAPASVVSAATWFELGAFRDATCSELLPSLDGGIPFSGAAVRVGFRSSKASPSIGKLPFGSYAIGAVARSNDCSVIARGCSEAQLGDTGAVDVKLEATQAGGVCLAGSACQAGQCVPTQDNSDPSLSSGCPLRLLGAGPLGIAFRPGGELLSSPSVTVTEKGFLIGYREVDSSSGEARRTVVPIDVGGGVFRTLSIGLTGRCPSSDEGDGAAIAHGLSGALFAFARKPCAGLQGIDYIALDAAGNDVKYNFLGDTGIIPSLSPARALANRPGTDDFLLAVLERTAPLIVPVSKGSTDPAATKAARFACDDASAAAVSVSNDIVALASVGAVGSTTTADGGIGSPTSEGGVRTVLLKATDALDPNWCAGTSPPEPARMPGGFVSLATAGTRTVVVSNGTSGAAYRMYEGTSTQSTASADAVRVDGSGRVLFADVAMRADRFFIAAEKPGAISLISFTTDGTPRREREFLLHGDPRVPPIVKVRDGRLAVAASDNRVAVAWTTARSLQADEPLGGYAIFSCAP